MIDLKLIMQDPESVKAALKRRGANTSTVDSIASQAAFTKKVKQDRQAFQTYRNAQSKKLASMDRDTSEAKDIMEDIRTQQRELDIKEQRVVRESVLEEWSMSLPNLPADDAPEGLDESANVVHDVWVPTRGFTLLERDHVDLGTAMGLMDFELATKIAGPRNVVLRGALAKLERVLGQWMLDRNSEANWEEFQVPVITNGPSLEGTGQLPKFEDDLYKMEREYLIPTAEVPLTNVVRNTIIPVESLPMRMTALTSCFRKEAGSAGRDTKGMIRQHQFNKVELVSLTTPEDAEYELMTMRRQVHFLLKTLGLPHREVELCAGDLGFSARKTFDFEVWIPSQHTYREISSVSWCGDFQARRMAARYKDHDGSNKLLHTLNGSALAVGRTLVAIMENYQREDGGIDIPEPLQAAMRSRYIGPDGKLF